MRQSTISCSALLLVLLSLVAPSACFRRPTITTTAATTATTLSRSISVNQGRRDLAFSTESIALLNIRGGAEEDQESDSDSDDEEEDEENDEDNDTAASEEDESDEENEEVEEEVAEAESEEQASEDEYDEEYDVEEEEEEKAATLVASIKTKSQDFVEPYFQSPMIQLYTTFGAIMLSKRVDLFSPTIVLILRFAFIAQLVLQQLFIIYVRIVAKNNNDRTPIELSNPLSNVLKSQLENNEAMAGSMANGMVKDLASSFLKSESTVMEYDRKQATSMQGGMVFNMAFMWFLHFKLGQVQPLLIQTCSGLLNLVYSPLFQVYILGRNLERPFKSKSPFDANMDTAPAAVAEGASDETEKEEKSAKKAAPVKSKSNKEDETDNEEEDQTDDEEDSDDEEGDDE